jgi:hypothetical protein
MVYDSTRDRFVFYTGASTWEFNPVNGQWVDRTPAVRPSTRTWVSLSYDPDRKVSITFGGWNQAYFGDTWEWDGAAGTWTERHPSFVPPAAQGPGLAYDPVRKKTIMIGGPGGSPDGHTYEWDGSNWTDRFNAAAPGAGGSVDAVYDNVNGRVLEVFVTAVSGVLRLGTKAYRPSDAAWIDPPQGCDLPFRTEHSIGWDTDHGRLVLFGGANNVTGFDDLWTWSGDGAVWKQFAMGSPWPPGRYDAKLVYDPTRHHFIMFSGVSNTGAGGLDDFWQLQLP